MNGQGAWNAFVAGTPIRVESDFPLWIASAEYTWNNWVFAAEYENIVEESTNFEPGRTYDSSTTIENWYLLASCRLTDWWEVGAYYTEAYGNKKNREGNGRVNFPAHTAWQKDLALATHFSLTNNWLIKAEIHFIDGTSLLTSTGGINGDIGAWEQDWLYGALRTTYSF